MITEEEVDLLILEHFGTKGMRWGVRKSEDEKQASRNVKAKKYEDRAKDFQSQLDKLAISRNYPYKYLEVSKITQKRNVALSDAERKRQGKLSKRQKQVVIGASVAAGILGTAVVLSSLSSGNARRLATNGKAFVTGQKFSWKQNTALKDPNLDVAGIMDKVVSPINRDFNKSIGAKMNCRRATLAYEMRRRGYDVAATKTPTARGQDISGVYNMLHPNANLAPPGRLGMFIRRIRETPAAHKPFTTFAKTHNQLGIDETFARGGILDGSMGKRIVSSLSKHPDGARGELGLGWNKYASHSIAWEKVKGKVVFFDTQSGIKYTGQNFEDLASKAQSAGVTRLDNLQLNEEFLKRWLKNA